MVKGFIFDFNRTLYDPDVDELTEGCEDLLERLMKLGYGLCLLSKEISNSRKDKVFKLGLSKYFGKILIIQGEKAEEHLRECLGFLRSGPLQVAMVGDRVEKEIFLGNKLGMVTIWYQAGKFANVFPTNELEKPTVVITRLTEILDYLTSL